MNQKGWVKEGFVLVAILLVFIIIATLISPQLRTIVGTFENAAPPNTQGDIYAHTRSVISLFVIVGVVGMFIYFVASSLNTEHEYQVFSKITLTEVISWYYQIGVGL